MITIFESIYRGVDIRYLPGGKLVELREDIFLPDGDIIKAGFQCDLDSVARFLGPVYAWFKGRTVLGAIVHDHHYRNRKGKKIGDTLFLKVMKWEQVKTRYRNPIYSIVYVFGRFYYPA